MSPHFELHNITPEGFGGNNRDMIDFGKDKPDPGDIASDLKRSNDEDPDLKNDFHELKLTP